MPLAAWSSGLSVTAGTVMHRSKLPLPVWFWAAHLIWKPTSNGMSAARSKLEAQLGITYKTAWLLTQKLRLVDGRSAARAAGGGVVEVDQAEIPFRADGQLR